MSQNIEIQGFGERRIYVDLIESRLCGIRGPSNREALLADIIYVVC